MSSNMHAIISIAIMSIVTALLRFLPFFVFSNGKKTPRVVLYLGKVLPAAIMAMLVVYCLKGVSFGLVINWLPALLAGIITSLSYVFKKNTLISIVLGTAAYMIFIRIM